MKTNATILAVIALSVAASALAQSGALPTPAATQAATATAPAGKAPDLLKGVIDPYDAAEERARFFKATSKESELTEELFNADAQREGGFVRKFDSWKAMLAFDKNRNGKIDWFEADAYRQDLRAKVFKMFAGGAGKLEGASRDEANRLLASGKLPRNGGGTSEAEEDNSEEDDESVEIPPGRWTDEQIEVLKKLRDMTPEERREAIKGFSEDQRRELIARYDTTGTGNLTDEQKKAMQNDMRVRREAWRDGIVALQRKLVDTDQDGTPTDAGKAQFKAFGEALGKIMKEEVEEALYQKDETGKVTDEERKRVQGEMRKMSFKILALSLKYMDADGDGKVTLQEREAFETKARDAVLKWAEDFIAKYEKTGAGRYTTQAERDDLLAGIREEIAKRKKKYVDEAGLLTPENALRMAEEFANDMGIKPAKRKADKPEDKPQDKPAGQPSP
ncbi:MAG: hypothetical protein ACE15C_17490 [Phycisphaerae bacterium]